MSQIEKATGGARQRARVSTGGGLEAVPPRQPTPRVKPEGVAELKTRLKRESRHRNGVPGLASDARLSRTTRAHPSARSYQPETPR
jgi:hypothetical protein